MQRLLLALGATVGTIGTAAAQNPQPYYQPSPFYQQPSVQPNIYNSQNQPLSPYLNMFSNNNPAARYYFGTRPGTVGGTGFGIGAPNTAMGGNRAPFFPQLSNAPDPLQPQEVGAGNVLPPAGHPVVFNNTLGYFPSPFGGRGSGTRNGLSGFGASAPPARTR